ncbi:MAG: lysylphosphatidylglycerol synthase domain-containing protein [Caulobacteraceae bacterium]
MTAAILRRGAIVAVIAGLAGATAVIGYIGFGQVLSALARIGWRGLATLIAYSALPYALLGSAWFILERPWRAARWRIYVLARMVRDASGELLPFSHVGGLVIGARAAMLQGIAANWAFATTTVDVTAELVAQVGFTCLGLVLLFTRLDPRSNLAAPALAGVGATVVGLAGFVVVQRRGADLVTGIVRRILPAAAARAAETGAMIGELHRRPGRLALAIALHLTAWIASALGVWLALEAAGIRIGPVDILGLEALVMAVRSAIFVAPMGVGVQEASYALLGPLFGLSPDIAVGLSLIKRARELTIGLPVLAAWQAIEGRRLASDRV